MVVVGARRRGRPRAGRYVANVSADASASPPKPGISRGLVLLLALTCGAAVANLYYAQPLLHTLSHAFGVSQGTAGLLITITQIGYVIGLALLVPLGDLLERRRMITMTILVTVVALLVAAAAPSYAVFAAGLAVIGVTASVAQVIVPMSSTLAADPVVVALMPRPPVRDASSAPGAPTGARASR